MVSFDDLLALRVTLQDEYTDEADIIRQLKSYLLSSLALEEIDEYLHQFYNESFGINIPIEELREVKLDRRYVRRIQRNNVSNIRNVFGDIPINMSTQSQNNSQQIEVNNTNQNDVSSNNNSQNARWESHDNHLDQILDNVLEDFDEDSDDEEEYDGENEEDDDEEYDNEYNDLPDLIDMSNQQFQNIAQYPAPFMGAMMDPNILQNAQFMNNLIQGSNQINDIIQNLNQNLNNQNINHDPNFTNYMNYINQISSQLIQDGQEENPFENQMDGSGFYQPTDNNSLNNQSSNEESEETEESGQNLESENQNQNDSNSPVNINGDDNVVDVLPQVVEFLTESIHNTLNSDGVDTSQNQYVDSSNQTINQSNVRRGIHFSQLPASRRRRNTLGPPQIFQQLVSNTILPQQMQGFFNRVPMNMPLNPVHMEDVRVTLEDNDLDSIKKIKYSDLKNTEDVEKKCAICMTKFDDEETLCVLKCKHIFHEDCIKEWLKDYSYKCPVCREECGAGKYDI